MSPLRVKICGLTRRPDAELAAASGADFGGVILAAGGRRSLSADAAAELFDGLPLRRVGVFVDEDPATLRRAARLVGLSVVQLHGSEEPAVAEAIREEGPWEVWKALRPRSTTEFLSGLERYAGAVDGILLDGWSAAAAGGTGALFPWEAVARVRNEVPRSLCLVVAGGLSAENVATAIGLLQPSVVDVSSGVEESPGVKSATAVPRFITAARAAAIDPNA